MDIVLELQGQFVLYNPLAKTGAFKYVEELWQTINNIHWFLVCL